MKKFILFISLSLMATLGSAQVICYVEPPSANTGNYDFTYATNANGWTNTPDLTIPANAVQDTLAFAYDATAADSLCCDNSVMNNVNGKIAVVYRGACEFGSKAWYAEQAGAVAVVIVNNVSGNLINMLAGAEGPNVTIPVIFVSDLTGQILKNDILAENTVMFIGNKTGFYGDDLGIYPQHIFRPEQFARVELITSDDTEFVVELGAWVVNYGSDDAHNVVLNCTVDVNGGALEHDVTSAPVTLIPANDSAYIHLPTYSEATDYEIGYYDIVYTVTSDSVDNSIGDNTIHADFIVNDSLYAYCEVEDGTFKPAQPDSYYRGGATGSVSNRACLVFNDPNASRLAPQGMTFSFITTTAGVDSTSLDGKYVEIELYQWDDVFTDVTDAAYNSRTLLTAGDYIYTSDAQAEWKYVEFDNQEYILLDNQNYLFCVSWFEEFTYIGYDIYNYLQNIDSLGGQPYYAIENDGNWGSGYTSGSVAELAELAPALTVHFMPSEGIGFEESEATPEVLAYPNPANVMVNIPVGENYGDIVLTITDLQGKVVRTQNISMVSPILTVDVTELSSGAYIFNLLHGEENETFTVNVNK